MKKILVSIAIPLSMFIATPTFPAAEMTINFVSILEIEGVSCFVDIAEVPKDKITDAAEETMEGMALAASKEFISFRGILRAGTTKDLLECFA